MHVVLLALLIIHHRTLHASRAIEARWSGGLAIATCKLVDGAESFAYSVSHPTGPPAFTPILEGWGTCSRRQIPESQVNATRECSGQSGLAIASFSVQLSGISAARLHDVRIIAGAGGPCWVGRSIVTHGRKRTDLSPVIGAATERDRNINGSNPILVSSMSRRSLISSYHQPLFDCEYSDPRGRGGVLASLPQPHDHGERP
jgi:hypothetical protein